MSAKKVNSLVSELFIAIAVVFLLLLSSINLGGYFAPSEVLGIETTEDDTDKFWQEFLTDNPDYVPGWIELKRNDKVIEIDPNYLR